MVLQLSGSGKGPGPGQGAAGLPEDGGEDQASRGHQPGATYSTEVQQRPQTADSSGGRQHTQRAGTTAKSPAAPVVRDEEAALDKQQREQQRHRTASDFGAPTGVETGQARPKDRTNMDDVQHD